MFFVIFYEIQTSNYKYIICNTKDKKIFFYELYDPYDLPYLFNNSRRDLSGFIRSELSDVVHVV
jgi:exonuclease I